MVVLLWLGLPLPTVLATLKCSEFFGKLSALHRFAQHELIDWGAVPRLGGMAVVGGAVGSYCQVALSPDLLEWVIVVMFIGLWLYLTLFKRVVDGLNLDQPWLLDVMFLGTCMYWGFVGSGGGMLALVVLHVFGGYSLVAANANKTLPTLLAHGAGLLVVATAGSVSWGHAVPFSVGAVVGAWVGVGVLTRTSEAVARGCLVLLLSVVILRFVFS